MRAEQSRYRGDVRQWETVVFLSTFPRSESAPWWMPHAEVVLHMRYMKNIDMRDEQVCMREHWVAKSICMLSVDNCHYLPIGWRPNAAVCLHNTAKYHCRHSLRLKMMDSYVQLLVFVVQIHNAEREKDNITLLTPSISWLTPRRGWGTKVGRIPTHMQLGSIPRQLALSCFHPQRRRTSGLQIPCDRFLQGDLPLLHRPQTLLRGNGYYLVSS